MYNHHHDQSQQHHHHYHHHHHGSTSFPSPNASNVPMVTCCGSPLSVSPQPLSQAGLYSGSQTLPMFSNHNQDLNLYYNNTHNRTRTLPYNPSSVMCNMLPLDQWHKKWWYLSPKTASLFFLSMVFIMIWSSMISGMFINRSYRELENTIHTAKLFELQKDVGQFAFGIGKEMCKFNLERERVRELVNHINNFFLSVYDQLLYVFAKLVS